MHKFLRRTLGLLVVGVCSIAIAACGSDSSSTNTAAAGSSTGTADSGLPQSKTISTIKSNGEIRVGVATTPPFVIQDPSSKKYIGPAATLADATAKKLGVKVKWVPETYDTIIAALQAGQIDLAAAGLYATPERLKVVDMTEWSQAGFCYLVKKSSPLKSLDQLNSPDVTMGNITGTGTASATADKFPKAKQLKRVASPGEQALIPELISGKADVDPVDATLVDVYLEKYPQLKVIPAGCSGTNPDIPTPIAVAQRKGDAGFDKFMKSVVAENKDAIDAELKKFLAPKYMRAGIGG